MFHSARWDRRPRPHRRAGRGDRQRGERGAVRPRDRARWSARSPCSSARANWVLPEGRRRRTPRSSSATFAADPDAVRGVARRDLHHHRPQPHVRRRRTPSARPSSPALRNIDVVEDPELRRRLDPRHPVRVQAAARVERLLPHVQPAARRARHRRRSTEVTEHGIVTADGAHAPGRHDHPRHRLHDDASSSPPSTSTGRDGRRHRRRVGRRRAGVPRHHHRRVPEPVHALRPEHQQRLDHLHDRVPGRVRHARCSTRWTTTTSPGST